MPVKKAAVNKNDLVEQPEHEIRASRQVPRIQPIAVAERIHEASNGQFWSIASASDIAHIGTAPLAR